TPDRKSRAVQRTWLVGGAYSYYCNLGAPRRLDRCRGSTHRSSMVLYGPAYGRYNAPRASTITAIRLVQRRADSRNRGFCVVRCSCAGYPDPFWLVVSRIGFVLDSDGHPHHPRSITVVWLPDWRRRHS